MRAKFAASSSPTSSRGDKTPPCVLALAVARRNSDIRSAENRGRQRSASSAGATRYKVPASASNRSRSIDSGADRVAAATLSSVQSESEDRAVEAMEPASLSGVRAYASSSSAAVLSLTVRARPTYSEGAVRLRRASTERMSPPRSRSQITSPLIKLEAARYQCALCPRLPSAVKWSASSAAAPDDEAASSGFQVELSSRSRPNQDRSSSRGANTHTGPTRRRWSRVRLISSSFVEVAVAGPIQVSSVGTTTLEVLPER